ncbi:hypothetical protein HanPSC8_Chr08g0327681 [Helianthus annuus]|nr:hypothetical protein HanPSC8_Chr08g0327681 [Helianthus annuus]
MKLKSDLHCCVCCLMFISREKGKAGIGFWGLCECRKKGGGMESLRSCKIL